ncbi:MAG: hypothetical protein ACLRWP_20680 [Bilophila wadsworthia]
MDKLILAFAGSVLRVVSYHAGTCGSALAAVLAPFRSSRCHRRPIVVLVLVF